jgi:hypothetical protein
MTASNQADNLWPFFPVFFVGMWMFVCFIISQLGWRAFSNRYPAPVRPPGRVYVSSAMWFGNIFASYRNAASVVFTDAGIYFYVLFLFRAFHPPFLVPWESLRHVEKKKGFLRQRYRLDIEDSAGKIHLQLPTTIEKDLFRFYMGPRGKELRGGWNFER